MAAGGPDWIGIYWALKTLIDAKLGTIDANIAAQLAALTTTIQASLASIESSNAAQLAAFTTTMVDVLTSLKTCDGKGNIVMADSFEHGMGEWYVANPTGGDTWVGRNQRKTGSHAMCYLLPASANKSTVMTRYIPGILRDKVGIEFSFTPGSLPRNMQIDLVCYGDGTEKTIRIYVYEEGIWRFSLYRQDIGIQTIRDMRGQEMYYGAWQTIKVVGDFTTGNYCYAVINNIYTDLSGIPMRDNTSDGNHAYVSIVTSHDAAQTLISLTYLDDVIITKE